MQRTLIAFAHTLEGPLRPVVKPVVPPFSLGFQQAGAQHRRERDGDNAGKDDRQHDGHRELVQQPANDAAHEYQRNEDRGERSGHRNDGEADLAGATERGLHRRLARLHMADHVLQHHDGIIHDEADGQRQREQRQIVEAVVQE